MDAEIRVGSREVATWLVASTALLGLAVRNPVPVLVTERAGRVLGERVAVALSVRRAEERSDDLEIPFTYIGRLAPEVGEAEVNVELEKVEA